MSGDKELFQIMDSRTGRKNKQVHFIPEEDASRVLKIDARIQTIKKYRGFIFAGIVLLAFLLGVSV